MEVEIFSEGLLDRGCGAEHTHLDTFNVGRVEGFSSQPDRHQYDDGLPGLA